MSALVVGLVGYQGNRCERRQIDPEVTEQCVDAHASGLVDDKTPARLSKDGHEPQVVRVARRAAPSGSQSRCMGATRHLLAAGLKGAR